MDRRVVTRGLIRLGLTPGIRPSSARAGQTLRIGLSLELTGKYRELAEMNSRGYELWRDDVNAQGGLLGRQVDLLISDDQSDPERSAEIYRELISQTRSITSSGLIPASLSRPLRRSSRPRGIQYSLPELRPIGSGKRDIETSLQCSLRRAVTRKVCSFLHMTPASQNSPSWQRTTPLQRTLSRAPRGRATYLDLKIVAPIEFPQSKPEPRNGVAAGESKQRPICWLLPDSGTKRSPLVALALRSVGCRALSTRQ